MVKEQPGSPPKTRRAIFRPEAAQRYAQGQAAAVLPRLIAPPTFALLWILLATLGLSLLLSWFAQVPIFAQGTAVIVQDPAAEADNFLLITFLPANNLPKLTTNQAVYWQAPGTGERISQTVTAVSPTLISPAKIRETYPALAGMAVTQPSVVLTTTLETAVLGSNPTSQLGTLASVDVEIGSRRLLSLLPFLGRLEDENLSTE